MMTMLVLTVGGSSQPIVSSIRQNKPEKLFFICSDDIPGGAKGSYVEVQGQGMVCEKGKAPNILVQAEAESIPCEIIKIRDIDNPDACYSESYRLLDRIRQENPNDRIIADYTGGTKSMSSGLVLAALDTKEVTLGVQAGTRTNLEKVIQNTQFTRLTRGHAPLIHRQSKVVADSFGYFDYHSAINTLQDVLAIPDLPQEDYSSFQIQLVLARGLEAWDRFDHTTAWDMLGSLRGTHTNLVKFLEAVLWSRCKLDPDFEQVMQDKLSVNPKGHGYELVQDLVSNAERRALQGKYDDAVGRLYRAAEMLAQATLKLRHEIETGDVDLQKIPSQMKVKYEHKNNGPGGRIQIGLREGYELLAAFENEPLGKVYISNKNKLIDFLKIRNNSLYAHGFTPIAEKEYRKARALLEPLFKDGLAEILKQKDTPKIYEQPFQFPASI